MHLSLLLLVLLFDLGVDKVQLQGKATTVGRHAELAYSYRKSYQLLRIQKLSWNFHMYSFMTK